MRALALSLLLLFTAPPAFAQPAAVPAQEDPHRHEEPHEHAGEDPHGHADEDPHGHNSEDPHGHGAEAAHFTVAEFERFGVSLATAGPGLVDAGVELPGEVRPNGDRTAHLAAPFAGRAREVRVSAGDVVRAGTVLAIIESATLAPYPLTAPFDGTIVDRHVAAGETVTPERPAFVLADLTTVWVELSVYQKDLAAVRVGERVHLSAGAPAGEAESTVVRISPVLDQATRTASARCVLPNPDGTWRPGLFVTASLLDPQPAAIVVPRTAMQRLDGATVVFVVSGDTFAPRPVRVGRTGRLRAEIVDGLAAGERYAAAGTFLLKAELSAGGDDPHGH